MNWIKVYDLANDKAYIQLVQQSAIRWIKESSDAGQDRPLVGSPEWWKTVESGEIESHWATGTIKRPLWTGMNDFPEVEVQEESGNISQWPRRGDVTEYSKGPWHPDSMGDPEARGANRGYGGGNDGRR